MNEGVGDFALTVVAFIVVTVLMGVRQAPQGYNYTVERFGKYNRTLTPGLGLIFPYVAHVKPAGPAPAPGTPVLVRELAVGTPGSSSGREALGLIRLDQAEEAKAAGQTLSAGGVGLALAD